MRSVNPTTGETIRECPEMLPEAVTRAVEQAHQAFANWRAETFAARAEVMKTAARILRSRSAQYAKLMAEEMGKPVRSGRAEAEKCAWACDYYAGNAERLLQPEMVETGSGKSFVTFQPLGVVLAVMPWNFPFWQVFRFAAPALMAGNVVVLKHASNVSGCGLAIEEIFGQAGSCPDILRTLLVGGSRAGDIIRNPLVKAVTLTGSTEAGKEVARTAGEMLKKTVLELGGSDPYLVLEDADLETAAEVCVDSRLTNSGQSCIAAKRFIVVEPCRGRFEALVVELMRAAKLGDPMQEDTAVGPLARHDLRDNLHRQVVESVRMGARCLLGGKVPQGKGAFYTPTVLTDVRREMPAYEEELFGPVAAIISVKDEEEGVRVANDSCFGLGAAVFTRDLDRGERIATTEIEAGSCFVNASVKSDPRLPFGGIKSSGYGRELSHYGLREFVNVKTVVVRSPGAPR